MPASGHLVASTMYMPCHNVSQSASGGTRTGVHATMASGASTNLSWCMPRSAGTRVSENQCKIRAIFWRNFNAYSRLLCRGTHTESPRYLVRHHGIVMSQKRAISFRRHLDFDFFEFLKVFLLSQHFQASPLWPKLYICALQCAPFSLPIKKSSHRPFANDSFETTSSVEKRKGRKRRSGSGAVVMKLPMARTLMGRHACTLCEAAV